MANESMLALGTRLNGTMVVAILMGIIPQTNATLVRLYTPFLTHIKQYCLLAFTNLVYNS